MYRKLSDIISVDDSGAAVEILVNNQWSFMLPAGLKYETDANFELLEGGFDLSGNQKPLVIKEPRSAYDQVFHAAVAEQYSFTGDHATIIDCKYDNRFSPDNGMNSQKVIVDEPDFYVDLTSVNIWPFGVEAEIRVRGDHITPYNISMVVKPEGDDHWQHIATYFKEIAGSVRRVNAASQKRTTTKKSVKPVTDPNCIMDGTVLKRYIGREADVVLPEGITALADNIFSGRANLRSITIPEGVTSIGRRAFESCISLQRVTLPESLRELGGYAFVDCHNLVQINLCGKLQLIEGSLFSECFKLNNVVIPDTAKSIDAFAFKNCRAFTKIVIPESVKSIGFTAFANCTNLAYLYIPASVTQIMDNFLDQSPFDGCTNLTIHCPAGSYAQEYARQHNINYEIDNTVPAVSHNKDCSTGAAEIRRNKAETPGYLAKNGWPVAVPQGVDCICADFEMDAEEDGRLVGYAGRAKDVVIPCGVKSIGENAFFMKKITSVVIPEGVTKLEDSAFWGCEQLTSVQLPSTLEKIGADAFHCCDSLTSIVIPEGITELENSTFQYCKQLTSVQLPSTLEKIGPDAFHGCKSLISIVIPEGVREIESNAFSFCSELKHVYLPESLWNIAYDAFCTLCDDTTLHVPQFSSAESYAQDNDLNFDHKKPGKAASASAGKTQATSSPKAFIIDNNKVTGYYGTAPEVIIPEGITAITANAFAGDDSVERVVIPEGVKTLGKDCFVACKNLKEVVLPESLTTLSGFSCCSELKKIHIPAGVRTIGSEAFNWCSGLEEIILPYGVKKIGKEAFGNYNSTRDVHIPETVTDIHDQAFTGSLSGITLHVQAGSFAESFAKEKALKFDHNIAEYAAKKPEKAAKPKAATAQKSGSKTYMVESGKLIRYNGKAGTPTIPKDVTVIGSGAFVGNEGLLCTELPEAVVNVEPGAFQNCLNLFRIIIPETVKSIAKGAFVNCPKLYIDTMEGSFAAQYGKENGIPVRTDGLYGQRPGVAEKVAAARWAAAEAARIRKEEEARRRQEYEERCRREAEERERKAAEEAKQYRLAVLRERRNRYDQLMKQIADQNRIISENRGWFGAQAKARKDAQQWLADLQAQLAREFPNGRP